MNGPREIVKTFRSALDIVIQPFFKDHHFQGKAVLPAVETMQILADAVRTAQVRTNIFHITEARFDKFIHLKEKKEKIPAFCDFSIHANGDVTVALSTKTAAARVPITRTKTHARMTFHRSPPQDDKPERTPIAAENHYDARISSDRIYRELVPFGPAYQNIHGDLLLTQAGAVGNIQTPGGHTASLGSPFALDAALHVACIWGQRYSGIVAFPVGLEKRRIFKTVAANTAYICRIVPTATDGPVLVFNIWLHGRTGTPHEVVTGVQMRDVSAGRMKPPEWIMAER